MSQREHGFTLIELMIVVAIIGILATLATSAYQTYTIRAQVSEGINFAAAAKTLVVDAFTTTGVPPAGRVEAGMTPDATDSSGTYVSQVNIIDGRIEIRFGGSAHADIQGDTLSLTPYVTSGASVAWRCGFAPAPGGALMSGGGETAAHVDPTLDERYLPATCR